MPRYFNVGAVKKDGGTRSAQLWTDDCNQAMDLARKMAAARMPGEAPIVAMVVHDTATGTTLLYDVVDGQPKHGRFL